MTGWRGGEGGWEGREGWREKMRGREKEAGFQSLRLKFPFDLVQSLIRTSAEAVLIYTPFKTLR